MTMIGLASRPSDGADPRRTQKRVAVSPSGRQVLIDISGDDRLRLINKLPGRWPDVMKARERGETLEQISRWTKVPPPCRPGCRFKNLATRDGETWVDAPNDPDVVAERVHDGPECLAFLMSRVYAALETDLHDLANRRARLLP
jgi:hypothetical protein